MNPTTGSAAAPESPPAPRPRPEPARGPRAASRPAAETAFNPIAALHALRRQWKLTLALALPAALAAAAALWLLVPARYTAFALLRIAASEPRLVFDTAESKADFGTYRQTQTALITSRFVLNAALRKPGVADSQTLSQQPFPLAWLESQLEIGQQRSPEILRIAMSGERPDELAAIVNAVKDAYLEEVVHAERRDRLARLSDLERIFQETDEKARHKQNRAEKLAKQLGTGDSRALTLKQQMALEYFSQLQREYSRVRFELMREQIDAGSASPDSDVASSVLSRAPLATTGDEGTDQEASLLHRRAAQVRDLIARFEKQVVDKSHPALIEHRRQLQLLESQIAELGASGSASLPGPRRPITAVVSRREALLRQEKLLKEEVEKYSALVDTIGASTFELEAMQTELAQVTKVSDRIGQEIEALRIELQSPPRVVPLQAAEVPQSRDLGKKIKLTGMAGFGVFGGILAAFLVFDLVRRRLSSAEELTREAALPILAMLPDPLPPAAIRGRRPLTISSTDQAIDSLRVRIGRLLGPDGAHRILLLASAAPEDSGVGVACALARSYVAAGRRSLLVDLDLRRPAVHRLLGYRNDIGAADVLRREIDWRTATHTCGESGLSLLSAGVCSEDALIAIARGDARPLLHDMRDEFDIVLVIVPPVLLSSEAAEIGQHADAALLVVRRDVSRLPLVVSARDQLQAVGISLLGAVFQGQTPPTPALQYTPATNSEPKVVPSVAQASPR